MEGDILMVPEKKHTAVLFISKNRLSFYESSLHSILNIDIPQDIIKDSEVINKERLYELIKSFVTTNAIPSCYLIIVLSDSVLFEKNVTGVMGSQDDQHEGVVQGFLDNIPFENLTMRIYQMEEKMLKVIATNRELTDAIITGFEKQGFSSSYVVPTYPLGKSVYDLDVEIATYILANVEVIKDYGIYTDEKETIQPNKKTDNTKKGSKSLSLLIGIFILALIGFGIFYFVTQNSPKSSPASSVATP